MPRRETAGSTRWRRNSGEKEPGSGSTLARDCLLGPDLLFSHGQGFTEEELDLPADAGVTIVAFAESELEQGADPVTWRALQHGAGVSIGADSIGSVSGDLFRHMQITLKAARGSRNRLLDAQGIAPIWEAYRRRFAAA